VGGESPRTIDCNLSFNGCYGNRMAARGKLIGGSVPPVHNVRGFAMRAVFLFAVVAFACQALADEDLFGPATEPPTSTDTPVQPGPYPTTDAPADDARATGGRATSGKMTITITASSIIVSYGKGEPQPPHRPGSRAIVVCDYFTMESTTGEQPKLHCQQCEVILPNGSTGQAGDVAFDSATKKLTLTGGDEQPVKLTSNDQGGIQEIVSAKMDIQLKFAPPQPSYPQPAAYIEDGSPFGPATTISPIHRTDKALIAD
jgi:hypothetical protein